jgi:hypothetical protein
MSGDPTDKLYELDDVAPILDDIESFDYVAPPCKVSGAEHVFFDDVCACGMSLKVPKTAEGPVVIFGERVR